MAVLHPQRECRAHHLLPATSCWRASAQPRRRSRTRRRCRPAARRRCCAGRRSRWCARATPGQRIISGTTLGVHACGRGGGCAGGSAAPSARSRPASPPAARRAAALRSGSLITRLGSKAAKSSQCQPRRSTLAAAAPRSATLTETADDVLAAIDAHLAPAARHSRARLPSRNLRHPARRSWRLRSAGVLSICRRRRCRSTSSSRPAIRWRW